MREKQGRVSVTTGSPDELGFHRVVERHEHFCILPDLTHHILESHEEGERWRGGKLCLPGQINILLLRLSRGEQRDHTQYWLTQRSATCT